ncbi:type II toxin-antitoxin system RelE/ParE family toxin [Helicobacter winghamensis]|uniref:type II toxin-antitoxin system RelE/ParE family toxin n=1 Tax=Helicobacter winghamensis TaxID=157268 RepID=UPI0018A3BA58|nr:type II toxin-antitoxin system YafQ family toxin [Helicobacter winghamensis]QOQ98570.1 type II toxin-antitoxin system YafQ family toxin [Helicobacter winghamensis]
MRKQIFQNSFKKDLKLVRKQNWDMIKIKQCVEDLANLDILPAHYEAHSLKGDFKDFRECHIFGDLVLIYKRDDKEVNYYRIGRHQDLFKKY